MLCLIFGGGRTETSWSVENFRTTPPSTLFSPWLNALCQMDHQAFNIHKRTFQDRPGKCYHRRLPTSGFCNCFSSASEHADIYAVIHYSQCHCLCTAISMRINLGTHDQFIHTQCTGWYVNSNTLFMRCICRFYCNSVGMPTTIDSVLLTYNDFIFKF